VAKTVVNKMKRNLKLLRNLAFPVSSRHWREYIPATDLDKLWILQDDLIEHKYPTSGITEYVISSAGDIYREMADEHPWLPYIDEKWTTLSRYCFIGRYGFGFVARDFEELRDMVKEPDYDSQRITYMANLQKLREATVNTSMDPKRKRVMLASLDMIKALADWFNSLIVEMPAQVSVAFDELTDAIANYFPRQFFGSEGKI